MPKVEFGLVLANVDERLGTARKQGAKAGSNQKALPISLQVPPQTLSPPRYNRHQNAW